MNDLDKEKYLLEVLNSMLSCLPEITYSEFNRMFIASDKLKLMEYEQKYNELGLTKSDENNNDWDAVSTLSIIATITDILCGKRLAIVCDEDTFIIKSFTFYIRNSNET
jgi:hypothetical protein